MGRYALFDRTIDTFRLKERCVPMKIQGKHLYPISETDPIHRDDLKIIKLFAQNLRRHFFVRKRERYYTLRLAHVFGCHKLALAVQDNALHHDFLL